MRDATIPLFKRFHTRLLLLVLLTLLPALSLAVYTNLKQRQVEKKRATDNASALAKLAAANQEAYIKNTRQMLGTLAQAIIVSQTTNRVYGEFQFNNLRRLSPDYLDFGIIEADGTLFGSATRKTESANVAGQAFFDRTVQSKRFSVGDYSPDGLAGAPNLGFGQPVVDAEGRMRRIFYTALNTEVLASAAAQLQLPPGGELTVLDRSGTVVTRHPNGAKWAGRSLTNELFVQRILKHPEGVFELKNAEGVAQLYAVATVHNGLEPCLYACVSIPTAVSYAQANQMLAASLAVLGIVAIAVLLAAQLYAHKYFLDPVVALADSAQRLARGDLSARTGLAGGQGELSELARAFDEMAAKLQQRQAEIELANREIRTINAELEARVRDRTAQLESANRELEAFSYSTSHDLRAPLRHIGGFAKMLQTHSAEKLDEEGRRYLTVIADSTKKMGCLIDDLLVFSRMGRQAMSRTTVNLNVLLQEVVAEVGAEYKGRAIDWVISPLPDVHADPGLMRLVWLNLVRNAVKYSAPRERVHVEIGVSLSVEGEHVFHVRDRGVGFDMQYAGKLFGVFQRLHADSEFEGTGIGLANVRRIITRHGGRTWAEGRLNEGATFYFSLPQSTPAKN